MDSYQAKHAYLLAESVTQMGELVNHNVSH